MQPDTTPEPIVSTRSQILAHLQMNPGQLFRLDNLASMFHSGPAATRTVCVGLVEQNLIRQSTGARRATYYVPTDEQLASERNLTQLARPFKPLKRDSAWRDQMARVREARNEIKSIG
jgi:DNA-binding MarR family transcriptional regulator